MAGKTQARSGLTRRAGFLTIMGKRQLQPLPEESKDASIRAAITAAIGRMEGEPLSRLYQLVAQADGVDGNIAGVPEVKRRALIVSNRASAMFSIADRRVMVECEFCRKFKVPGDPFVQHLRRRHPAQLLALPAARFE